MFFAEKCFLRLVICYFPALPASPAFPLNQPGCKIVWIF